MQLCISNLRLSFHEAVQPEFALPLAVLIY